MSHNPFRYFKSSREVIQLAVMMYVRFPLSLRNVEGLLHERGIDVCCESIRLWVDRFGPVFAKQIRSRRSAYLRQHTQWQWHLDEVFVKINRLQHYLWRAVDHEGEILECYVSKTHNKIVALRFLKTAMKPDGPPQKIVPDKLPSYVASMRDIGNQSRQTTEQYANNRAENSHRPFRRRERGMNRFRKPATLQKFTSTQASVYNHFNHQRHLESRTRFKTMRDVSLIEWPELVVA